MNLLTSWMTLKYLCILGRFFFLEKLRCFADGCCWLLTQNWGQMSSLNSFFISKIVVKYHNAISRPLTRASSTQINLSSSPSRQVTFLLMPLEIGWAYTVMWTAGDLMCRVMMFFRTFGLYLSSFILVCISLDR